jgi:hypothetical protein
MMSGVLASDFRTLTLVGTDRNVSTVSPEPLEPRLLAGGSSELKSDKSWACEVLAQTYCQIVVMSILLWLITRMIISAGFVGMRDTRPEDDKLGDPRQKTSNF